MGSPDFAVPSLHAVAQTCDLRVVVTQPDRPAGRGRKLRAPAVKQAALTLDVPILQPTKVRDGTLAAALREHDLDVIVVTAYGRILPTEILELPRLGCVNVHASALPRWRGAAPIQRAVLAGDAETGVSIMRMDEGCDTGPVFGTRTMAIGPDETSGELWGRMSRLGGEVLAEFLARGGPSESPAAQDESLAVHAPKLEKSEGRVDWQRAAARVHDHVRGMDPWPAAFAELAGARVKLFGSSLLPVDSVADSSEPGRVLTVDAAGMTVACGDGRCVRISEIQPAGKRRMAPAAYAASRPLAGERFDVE
jgi:methionyl-tRNA formyltransferase